MNKKIVALAVAAAFAIPAAAAAQTTLFGQFKYEVGYIDDGNDSNFVHSTRGTRIGIHGSEDLGGGVTGIFRFQGGLHTSPNDGMGNQTWRMNEENWVGVRGGFGTLQLGRSDTAIKKTGGNQFRFFVDSLAETSLSPGGAQGQRAEGIHYTTPNLGGFTGYLTLEPNGVKTDTYWAVGAAYQAGPFWVGGAAEGSPDDGTFAAAAIGPDETNYQLGAKWNFGQGEVGLLWQARNDADDNIYLLPVRYNLNPNVSLRAAVKHVDPDVGDSWTNYGVGASYNFSRRTEAFTHLWLDDEVRGVPGTGETFGGADEVHFSVGVRHSF